MVILIAGDTHTGKTLFAQRLLEKYKYPYLSIDHLKLAIDELIAANELNLRQCVSRNYNHILIEDSYEIDLDRMDLET